MKIGLILLLSFCALPSSKDTKAQELQHIFVGKWVVRQYSYFPRIQFGTPPSGSQPVIVGEDCIFGYYPKQSGKPEVTQSKKFEFNAEGKGTFWERQSDGTVKGFAFHWIPIQKAKAQYNLFVAFDKPTEHCARPLAIISAKMGVDGRVEFSFVQKNSKIGDGFLGKVEMVKTSSACKTKGSSEITN